MAGGISGPSDTNVHTQCSNFSNQIQLGCALSEMHCLIYTMASNLLCLCMSPEFMLARSLRYFHNTIITHNYMSIFSCFSRMNSFHGAGEAGMHVLLADVLPES